MTVVSKKSRAVTTSNGKGSGTLFAVALVVGSLCLRVFVLPARISALTKTEVTISSFDNLIPAASNNDKPQRGLLPTNPTGSLAPDIVSIEHFPERAVIVVTLKPEGRCPNPYLRGRLSGPALVLLEWSQSQQGQQQIGHYRVPLSGTYFVEIIAIVCEDFSQTMDFDFQSTCLEDPETNRLTRSNVKIVIDKNQAAQPCNNPQPTLGYWIHQADERAANNDFSAMYTRYQPRGCLRLNDPTHEHFHMPPKHCIEPTDWNRFEPYTRFQYYNPKDGSSLIHHNFLQSAKHIHADQPTTLCLVGGSHSRTLRASLMENYHNFTLAHNNVQIEWINVRFPRNVNNQTIVQDIAPNCHKIILAVGQWPASFSGNKPTLVPTFQREMDKLLGRLQAHLPASTEIWLRSIHENPLNDRIAGYCPPKDWRSPPTLAGYNAVLRRTARPNIRFVDTSFIVSPLWDASTDWGHVCPQASHVEALYLVAVVLGLMEPNTGFGCV